MIGVLAFIACFGSFLAYVFLSIQGEKIAPEVAMMDVFIVFLLAYWAGKKSKKDE